MLPFQYYTSLVTDGYNERQGTSARNSTHTCFYELLDSVDSMLNNYEVKKMTIQNKSYVVKENDQDYSIFIAVPGLTKEDVEVSVDKSKLSIKVKKENTLNVKINTTFDLEDIKVNQITAKVENGLLEIALPKEQTKYTVPVK